MSVSRILIAEDEILIALFLEDMLTGLGYQVAGVATTVAEGLRHAAAPDFDLAILDVHLNGEDVFALADTLAGLGLPFVFATGYGARGVPHRHAGRPVLQKPYGPEDLHHVLQAVASAN